MKIRDVTSEIDFADAEFKTFEMSSDDTLIIYFTSWDEREIKLNFKNATQFSYKLGGTVASVIEYLEVTPFLQESLKLAYDQAPLEYPYSEFQVIDTDGFPFIQVVSEELEIVRI